MTLGRLIVALPLLWCQGVLAEASVVDATAVAEGEGRYTFEVTVRSDDRGWDYYADAFEVLTMDGELLGRRELLHPHENEQPFTRALRGVTVPDEIRRVRVRARHNVTGYDEGASLVLELPH